MMKPEIKSKGRLACIATTLLPYIRFFFSYGCALMSKPDSCEHEVNCDLNSVSAAQAIELDINDSRLIHVCACNPWNESGLKVREGQHYSFNIEYVTNWVDGDVPSDPIEGWQDNFYKVIGYLVGFFKRSDQARWYVLVGAVGLDDENTFAVFKSENDSVTMSKSGVLYFYANHKKGRYFNNHGSLMLKVVRMK